MSYLGITASTEHDWKLWLGSKVFTHAFVRLDGQHFTRPSSSGGGTANCQWVSTANINAKNFGSNELLKVHGWFEGDDQFIALESVQFPNRYLRLYADGVTQYNPVGGSANLQYHTAPPTNKQYLEVFKIHYEGPDQIPHLESTRYPGVFLRIDAQNLTAHQPNGGGTINGSFGKTEDTKLHDIFYV